jgi:cysteinyl-tRNA synthetase
VEEVVPIKKGEVGMYTCGPTVYSFAHIGHGRKYVMDDLLKRVLMFNGYKVRHVMNITDVGHLVSDADEGEDKLEKGALREKKTVWQVAQMYIDDFAEMTRQLNIVKPDIVCRATEEIPAQIELITKLMTKGFAYETPEAVYFDVGKFPRYNGLFGMEVADRVIAARDEVQTGEHKKNSQDFALWFKLVGRFVNHTMRWESPWGWGFPGWHIECSAMSQKYLGESFDIHTGGLEHQMVHHPNEIAQSEAATGKQMVKYWVHYGFLTVDGQKMAKSQDNFLRVVDVVEKGFSSMALRYLYLTAYYKTPLNFTWSSIAAAQGAYDKLVKFVIDTRTRSQDSRVGLSKEKLKKLQGFQEQFRAAVNNDLGTPQALAVLWEMMHSNIPDYDKLDQLLEWDEVLGLGLANVSEDKVPEAIALLGEKRLELRKKGEFVKADQIRAEMEKMGWVVEDSPTGPRYKKNSVR